jgi:hypothetical protein
VTDVVVINGADFKKDGQKTLDWKVVPENANTRTGGYWTLGEADGNITLAKALGKSPPYHLGADLYGTSDPGGVVTINSSRWKYDYLNVAYVLPNGKAPGKRNIAPHKVGSTVMDKNGNEITITLQALKYDEDKDFVKLFRLVEQSEVDSTSPPPVYPSSVPVIDIVLFTEAEFTKGTTKTLAWMPVAANSAVMAAGYWTFGDDGNITTAKLNGETPPYHLGEEKYGTSDTKGEVTVEKNWNGDYLLTACVIPNGKVLGKRNIASHTDRVTIEDKDGKVFKKDLPMTIEYDKDKDFIKFFILHDSSLPSSQFEGMTLHVQWGN